MPNGKPGDHPLTNILIHKLEVYGSEADGIIREIATLSGQKELDEWWDEKVGWTNDRELVLREARLRIEELRKRARSHGWEID